MTRVENELRAQREADVRAVVRKASSAQKRDAPKKFEKSGGLQTFVSMNTMDELNEEPTTREVCVAPWHEGPGFVTELDAPFGAVSAGYRNVATRDSSSPPARQASSIWTRRQAC